MNLIVKCYSKWEIRFWIIDFQCGFLNPTVYNTNFPSMDCSGWAIFLKIFRETLLPPTGRQQSVSKIFSALCLCLLLIPSSLLPVHLTFVACSFSCVSTHFSWAVRTTWLNRHEAWTQLLENSFRGSNKTIANTG